MLRPFGSASIGPDAAAPVIDFERLLAGRQIEGHLSQTSKPLLDAIYGPLYLLTHDWRPVAWAVIAAFALSVVLAAVLADRVAGPASGAFAAFAFLASPILLTDISLAYGVTWMLLMLLIAGLAVTVARPRYWLAGLALMLASLARPETLAVVGVATASLIVAEVLAVAGRRPRPPRGAYLVLVGFLAVPVFMAHDGRLFGDALFWAKTAQINSQGHHLRGLVQMIAWMGHHFIEQVALLPLAAAGGFMAIRRRQWPLVIGLAGVVLGIATLFILIGARETAVAERYLRPIDLGLLFAAAIGVSALDTPAIRRWARRFGRLRSRRTVVAVAGGILVAISVAPLWPLDVGVRAAVASQVRLNANERVAIAAIKTALGPMPSWRDLDPATAAAARPKVFIPIHLRAKAVVDLDLPLNAVWYSEARAIKPDQGLPEPGSIVYHDRLDDTPQSAFQLYEIDHPVTLGKLRLVPILADPANGVWVIRVEAAQGP